jgi:hypothetical protein
MASFTYKLLAQVIPGTSASTVYTASGVQSIVRQINVINVNVTDCSFDLYQNGSSTINKIGRGTTMVPGNDGTYDGALEYDCYYCLSPSDTIQAKAGLSSALVLNLWGVEIT